MRAAVARTRQEQVGQGQAGMLQGASRSASSDDKSSPGPVNA
jgi:hypothetical protein